MLVVVTTVVEGDVLVGEWVSCVLVMSLMVLCVLEGDVSGDFGPSILVTKAFGGEGVASLIRRWL